MAWSRYAASFLGGYSTTEGPRGRPMSFHVVADLGLCQGHQMCQGEAPGVFGFDEAADLVTVLEEHADESLRSQVEAAVRYCPAMALAIEEEQ